MIGKILLIFLVFLVLGLIMVRLHFKLDHLKVVLYFEYVAFTALIVERIIMLDRYHQLVKWTLFVASVSERIKEWIL